MDAYRPVKGDEAGEEMFSASGTGEFNIVGLDAGTYTLVETSTPSGYNTCEPITVIISATHKENEAGTGATTDLTGSQNMNNTVENKKGSTLPTTRWHGYHNLLRCWFYPCSWRSNPSDHQEAHERTLIVLSARLIR